MSRTHRILAGSALALSVLLAGCQNEPVKVSYEGFQCSDVPGIDEFLEAADANNDNKLNSDEFNSAFQEAEDEVTPDGQLDRNELAAYVCQAKKKKAAAKPAKKAAAKKAESTV